MTDAKTKELVERLREEAEFQLQMGANYPAKCLTEAADELERLSAEVDKLEDEIIELRPVEPFA